MTIKTYLRGMLVSTLLSFAVWVLVLENVDPTDSGMAGFAIFYLTLFFTLTCVFSLLGFYFRRKIFENKIEFRQVEIAFRQGALLAITFTGLMLLQGQRQLSLYSAFIFVLLVVAAEFYFLIKK